MITASDPWIVQENTFDPARLHHGETVFTLGNGYFGTRGAFEENYPGEMRSTFLHGVFDEVPIVFTELANAPDWLELEISLAGERFGLDSGQVLAYQRTLDLRTALLRREVEWRSPQGRTTRLVFERFASLADEQVAGVRVSLTALDYDGTLEIRAGLNAEVDNLGLKHWVGQAQAVNRQQAWLQCRTRASGVGLAAGFQLSVNTAEMVRYARWNVLNHPSLQASTRLVRGQAVTVQKWATYATTRQSKDPLRAVRRRLTTFPRLDWQAAFEAHCQAWQAEWQRSDVIIEGDLEAQLAVRFNIFQLLAAAPRRDERVNIGAKTLSGYGYRGHSFWDTEIFMLPFFIYTRPEIARNLLSYRFHGLAGARSKAQANGYRGAQYPWESAATGEEVTPTWVPHYADRTQQIRIWTGDIEIHISADVAYAIWQYWQATGDADFLTSRGAEVILETARFWASRAEWQPEKARFEISDIIGPDENHDHVDNNAYTNAMAQWNIRTALRLLAWLEENHPKDWRRLKRTLGLKPAELQQWARVADLLTVLHDPQTHLVEQFSGYFERKDIPLASLEPRTQSVQSLLGIEGACATQVLKQPDVLMLMYLLPDLFEPEALPVNYAYYTARTDHTFGSSLGPSIQAIMAARMREAGEAYTHFMRAARADLFDVRGNAGDGIHGASAGGLWQAVVFGFAGAKRGAQGWETQACLPEHWTRVAFKLMERGQVVEFEVKQAGR